MNVYKQKRNFISLIRYRLWCSLFMIVAWTLNAIDAIPIDGIIAIARGNTSMFYYNSNTYVASH